MQLPGDFNGKNNLRVTKIRNIENFDENIFYKQNKFAVRLIIYWMFSFFRVSVRMCPVKEKIFKCTFLKC